MQLDNHDLMRCAVALPKDVVALLKSSPHNYSIAGGFIRACIQRTEPKDIDIFTSFLPQDAVKEFTKVATTTIMDEDIRVTKNACTVAGRKPWVQFIGPVGAKPRVKIVDQFDFTMSAAIMWWSDEQWLSYCSPNFYPDLASKRLRYQLPNTEASFAGPLLRILKFTRQGYHITPVDFATVLARVALSVTNGGPVDMSRPECKREQDRLREAYTAVLLEKLNANKPVGTTDDDLGALECSAVDSGAEF